MKKLYEHTDTITGEIFKSRVQHHYEPVDPTPFAPPVPTPRLSLRERIERMLYSPVDPLGFISDGTQDDDFTEGDDDPLTESESAYVAQNAVLERYEADRLKAAQEAASPLKPPEATPPAPPPADGPPTPPPAPAKQ